MSDIYRPRKPVIHEPAAFAGIEPVAWRVETKTLTGYSNWVNYYDFGAAHCPLNKDGTWKEGHPHHWQFNDSPSKQLRLVSVTKIYASPVLPPDGWVMVPKEPTKEMVEVWRNWGGPDEQRYVVEKRSELYKAMISVAPEYKL